MQWSGSPRLLPAACCPANAAAYAVMRALRAPPEQPQIRRARKAEDTSPLHCDRPTPGQSLDRDLDRVGTDRFEKNRRGSKVDGELEGRLQVECVANRPIPPALEAVRVRDATPRGDPPLPLVDVRPQ